MSSSSQSPVQNGTRRRAGSIQQALHNIESNPAHHLAGPFGPFQDSASDDTANGALSAKKRKSRKHQNGAFADDDRPLGLWNDIMTMKWMRRPSSSFRLLLFPGILYINWNLIAPDVSNPLKYLFTLQYRISDPPYNHLYVKGYGDMAFVVYYIIVFSFIRQSFTIYVLRPFARWLSIHKPAKIDRFTEQGYAIAYFTCTGVVGTAIMYNSQFWFFNTTPFWTEYPHWRLTGVMKSYYLVQLAYWFHQLLVLALRLEKPRKDFAKRVGHHVVTLWLIGWSYLTNCTPIGNAVFVTMDISDAFLGLVKSLNYVGKDTAAACAMVWFVGVWTYLRHYLNLILLWSVLTEFKLVPEYARQWKPEAGVYMAAWLQWQIFIPMLLLQLVNLFWYFLIWRIVLRAVFGTKKLEDDRSDDEGDDGQPETDEKDD